MKVLKWITGILFLLFAIVTFSESPYSAFCFFIAGITCVPPILKLIEETIRQPLPRNLKYIIVLMCFGVGILTKGGKDYSEKPPQKEEIPSIEKELTIEEQVLENPKSFLQLEYKGWENAGFGTVGIHNFNIMNTSPLQMKDIKIRFIYSGDSGTELNESIETVYKIVNPKSTLKVRDFNAGFKHSQATACRAEIIEATPIILYK